MRGVVSRAATKRTRRRGSGAGRYDRCTSASAADRPLRARMLRTSISVGPSVRSQIS